MNFFRTSSRTYSIIRCFPRACAGCFVTQITHLYILSFIAQSFKVYELILICKYANAWIINSQTDELADLYSAVQERDAKNDAI